MQFTIKQARKYAGFTQAKLANAIGVCRHRYMKIEKSQEDATVSELNKISKVTGIPVSNFILLTSSTNVDSESDEAQEGGG